MRVHGDDESGVVGGLARYVVGGDQPFPLGENGGRVPEYGEAQARQEVTSLGEAATNPGQLAAESVGRNQLAMRDSLPL